MKIHSRRHAAPALRPLALAIAALCLPPLALAAGAAPLPTGLQVVQGQATLATAGNRLTVTNSANAVLNWQQFSIGADRSVHFAQPGAASKVLNRVVGSDPSAILGSLSSNGQVWLLNPNGVLFGAGARVDVAGLVASTLRLGDADWAAGRLNLAGSADGAFGSAASVVNQGTLRTVNGGRVMLIGSGSVRNEGLIEAPDGQVLLAAGRSVELVDTGLPNLSVQVTAPQGEAVNLGTLLAGNGRIDLQAALVNQQGIVRADSLGSGRGGEVVLTASNGVELGAGSQTSANGATGGRVSIDGGSGTTLVSGGVSAAGSSGAGGGITLLGRQVGLLDGSLVDASGAAGGGAVRVGGGLQGRDAAYRNAEAVFMGPGSTIAADATASGNGGLVVLWSDNATRVYGSLSARGGPLGGNGGFIETSGGWLDARPSSVRATAVAGAAGQWLLDPFSIVISDTGTQSNVGSTPNFTSSSNPAVLLTSSIRSALEAGNDVTVTTGPGGGATDFGDITMTNATINPVPPISSTVNLQPTLTLNASRNIVISGSSIAGYEDTSFGQLIRLSLNLQAGQSGSPGSAGSVTVQNSTIDTLGGSLSVTAHSGATTGGSIAFTDSTVTTALGAVTISASPAGATGGAVALTRSAINAGGGNVLIAASAGATTSGTVGLSDSMIRSGGGTVPAGLGSVAITASSGGTSLGTVAVANPLGQIFGGPSIVANGAIRISADSLELGTGAQVESQLSGLAISLQGGTANTAMRRFINSSGASALVAPSRRWLVHVIDSEDAAVFTPGGLAPDFWQYNALPNSALPEVSPSQTIAGNGFRFAAAPTLVSGFQRVYDRTTTVDLAAFQAALTGLRAGHRLVGPPVFASQDAAQAVPVQLTSDLRNSVVWTGVDTPVYGYQGTTSLVGDITRRPVSVTAVSVANKTYDGARAATINSWSLSNVITNDDVTASGGGLFDTADAGTDKSVVATATSLGGTAAGNYSIGSASANGIASISQRTLSVGGVTVSDKVYDGSTAATVTGFSLLNVVGSDDVQATGTGFFDSAGVGTGKLVLATAVSLTGAAAGNYNLDPQFNLGGTLASITHRPLTMTNVVVADKVYDGGTTASVTSWTLAGLVGTEQVNTGPASGQFSSAAVGDAKTVQTSFSLLPGLGGANYTVVNPAGSATASITRRPLTLSGVVVNNKVYDGNTDALVLGWTLANVVGSEQVQVGSGTGQFSSPGVGAPKPVLAIATSLTGPDAGNYSLGAASTTGSASITRRPLSLASVTVADKVYDGSVGATVTDWTLGNVVNGDDVAVSAGLARFQFADVGNDKPVQALASSLAGADAGNYTLSNFIANGSASITPRPLSLSAVTVADKVYDGSTTATVTAWSLSNIAGLDEVMVASGSAQFASRDAGTAKPVMATATGLAGTSASNYLLASPSVAGSASITPRPLSLAGVAVADKVYDGNSVANVTSWSLANVVQGDQVQVGAGSGQFSDGAGVGMAKPVLAIATGLSGADAGNYSLGAASRQANASILPASLLYQADQALVLAGLPLPPLTGTVTGFVAGEALANATTGTLRFDSPVDASSAPGRYPIDGSGLAAANYSFAQAPGNATALTLQAPQRDEPPSNPYVTQAAVATVLPVPPATSPAVGRTLDAMPALLATGGDSPAFASLDLASLSPAALAGVLAARSEYKRALFAPALALLDLDPGRADAQPCTSPQQADNGQCLITGPLVSAPSPAGTPGETAAAAPAAPGPAPALAPSAAPAPAPAAAARVLPPPQPVVDLPPRRGVTAATLPQIQRKVALLIGIDQYNDPRIPRLGNAVNDARAVARSLETQLGYETVVLANANRSGIFRALNQLASQVGPADSVIVYYAGHGERSEKSGLGYWQPADADPARPDSWISNADIDRLIRQLPASQVALISDSCFSGSLVAGERIRGAAGAQDPAALLGRRAAVVMTSGGNEPVFDSGKNGHSPFAWNLMQSLEKVSSWRAGSSVFEQVRFAVARQLPQRPQYAAVPNAGHQPGADYLFEQRQLAGVVK